MTLYIPIIMNVYIQTLQCIGIKSFGIHVKFAKISSFKMYTELIFDLPT